MQLKEKAEFKQLSKSTCLVKEFFLVLYLGRLNLLSNIVKKNDFLHFSSSSIFSFLLYANLRWTCDMWTCDVLDMSYLEFGHVISGK